MGKGTIKSGGENGLYEVTVRYNRTKYEELIYIFERKISALEDQISSAEIELANAILAINATSPESDRIQNKIDSLKLQKLAVEKQKSYLEDHFPEDYDLSAWCADFSEELAGDVITLEVPGEVGTIQIAPGYDETTPGASAVYDASAGQLMPTITTSPAQAFAALSLLPGYQKWKPTFRYGTITAKDDDANTASVTLEEILSSKQNIVINQTDTLDDVIFEYMECDSKIFEVGDSVLIKFTGQSWDNPVIIGYKDSPKPCALECAIIRVSTGLDRVIVVDCSTGELHDKIPDGEGGFVSFPCAYSDLNYWVSRSNEIAQTQDEYWVETKTEEDRSAYGYVFKPGSYTIPGTSSTMCDGDELVSTWDEYTAQMIGDVVCQLSIVEGIGSTYANFGCSQKRATSDETFEVTCPSCEWVWGADVLETLGSYSSAVYSPDVFFDGQLGTLEILNGVYHRTCLKQTNIRCLTPYWYPYLHGLQTVEYYEIHFPESVMDGTCFEQDVSLGRFDYDMIEALGGISVDLKLYSTEKSCIQIFKKRSLAYREGRRLADWVYDDPSFCLWLYGIGSLSNPLGLPTHVYSRIPSDPDFMVTSAIDYKEKKLLVEGFDPKLSTRNDTISDFLEQCVLDYGGDFLPSWITVQFRTL